MVRRHDRLFAVIALMLMGVGCDSGPTYHQDIAPFVAASCLSCHDVDGASGLPLTTWPEVRAAAPAALAALRSGRMPAGNIDRSGECATFTGPEPVHTEDIESLARWVEAGSVEGAVVDPESAVAPPPFSVGQHFEFGPFQSDEGEHRCTLVEGDPDPSFLTALRVESSSPGAVHHMMLFTLQTTADVASALTLDAADDAPGWACEGPTGVSGASLAAVWTPGSPVVTFPDGTGLALAGGAMIVQLHLGRASVRTEATVTVDLTLATCVAHSLSLIPIAATGLSLPPGKPVVHWTETLPLPAPDLDVYGVFPHMHAMGSALSLRSPDECLVQAPRWDYGWQELAFYEQPVSLASGVPLELACQYSTLDTDEPTVWGESATDEMCMVFLLAGEG